MNKITLSQSVFSRRMVGGAALSVSSLFLVGLFMIQAHAATATLRTYGGKSENNSSSVVSTATAVRSGGYLTDSVYSSSVRRVAPIAASGTKEGSVAEVHIANNGLVLLRGARVASFSNGVINVVISLGLSNSTWTVSTNQYTKFFAPDGEKETLSGVAVGDIVTVTGSLVASDTETTIDADFVRG